MSNEKLLWTQHLNEILKKFKISPKSYSIYLEAFTHQSYAYANNLKYNYEKLEFLGDATIAWVTSNYIYEEYQTEGVMSQIKANLVSGSSLAKIAKDELGFRQVILIGGGLEEVTDKIYEDVFEAFIGAVYKDQGFVKVKSIIEEVLLSKLTNDINKNYENKCSKSMLQEYLMKNEKCASGAIQYVYDQNEQTEVWTAKVLLNSIVYGCGSGIRKKEAAENAAKDAISKLAVNKE